MKTTLKTFAALAAVGMVLGMTVQDASARSRYSSRAAHCRWEAQQAAREAGGSHVAGNALIGAGVGGAYGAITGGGAASNLVTGLALGGIGGGVVGAATADREARRAYREAYADCMSNY